MSAVKEMIRREIAGQQVLDLALPEGDFGERLQLLSTLQQQVDDAVYDLELAKEKHKDCVKHRDDAYGDLVKLTRRAMRQQMPAVDAFG